MLTKKLPLDGRRIEEMRRPFIAYPLA